MAWNEYLDLFFDVQKKKCPFRAFCFDVVDSRNQTQYNNNQKHYQFVCYVYSLLKLEEKLKNKQILLNDKYNKKYELGNHIFNGNNYNPMILSDNCTYFVINGSIITERMIEIFCEALNEYNINYSFHFSTGVYETNLYQEGNTKLYKGYMLNILEYLGKKNNYIINKNGISKEK